MDFLSEVEKKLDLPPGEKAQVIRELKSHYEELKGELVASGMDAALAAQETSRKLGDPADVASRLQAIHCRATWRTAALTALPLFVIFLGSILHFPLGLALMGNHASRSAIYAYHVPLLVVTALFGLIFLVGSIRELLHNRRPMWLATWLAVGIRELVSAVQRLEDLTRYVEGQRMPQVGVFPSVVLQILVLGFLAVMTYRRSTKWFLILGGWTVLVEAVYILVPWESFPIGWFMAFIVMANAPLVTAVALGLFARHPYGNTTQASLFLFAFYIGASSFEVRQLHWSILVANLLPPIVIVATVLAYARSSTWRQKLAILAGGIVATNSANSLIHLSAYQTAMMLFMLFWVILVPMLFERRWSDRRPEFVSES